MTFDARTTSALVLYAHVSVLTLGISLLLWGVAPAFVERIVTQEPPNAMTLSVGGGSLVLGFAFVALHVFIRRRARVALWTAFLLSLVIVTAWLAAALLDYGTFLSVFVPVLAGITTFSTWLALVALQNARDGAHTPIFTHGPTPTS
ncbi:MAG: hypothetical protein AB7Q17_03190 [Phycisphaerae bacterium]